MMEEFFFLGNKCVCVCVCVYTESFMEKETLDSHLLDMSLYCKGLSVQPGQ